MKRHWIVLINIAVIGLQLVFSSAIPNPMRVGVYQNEPKVFIDENGHPAGFYIDILEEISAKEGWQIDYVQGLWSECLDKLEKGELDLLVDVAYSKEREKRFDFNLETVLLNWSRLYTKKGSYINDIFDLEGKKIAVVRGDIAYGELRFITESFGLKCIFREVDSFEEALEFIDQGTAQAGLISRMFGLQNEQKYRVEKTSMVFSPYQLRFAVPGGRHEDILSAIDKHLIRLKQEKGSVYYLALDQWIKSTESMQFPVWVKYLILAVSGIFLFLAAFNILLKSQVRKRTAELERANAKLKKYHEQLESLVEERTVELTAANEDLKSFSYSVSHDLRAPLRAIDGFSRLLAEEYSHVLDTPGKGYLQRIRDTILVMRDLIEGLLKLSHVTSKAMEKTDVALSKLAHEVANQLRQEDPDRQVEFIIQDGMMANGDSALLLSALQNLLGNSWKFTKGKDQTRIEFGATDRDGRKVYFIKDNGAGFNMNFAEKLFTPFQRLHRTDEFMGTGIGLATVQRIIHRHGGQIWAEGIPNVGATFYFTL